MFVCLFFLYILLIYLLHLILLISAWRKDGSVHVYLFLFTYLLIFTWWMDNSFRENISFFSVHFPYLLVLFSLYLRGGWMAVFVSIRYVDIRLRSSASWNGGVSDLSWRVMC